MTSRGSTSQYLMTASVTLESDEELAWRAIREAEAFGELYRRYGLPTYRYHLARTGNDREARDLTSQTFIAAFECITSYRFGGRFVSWFFRLANHIQGNHLLKVEDRITPEPLPDVSSSGFTSERGAASHKKIAEMAREIGALSDDMAEALVLRFFAGLTPSEIGQVMVMSDAAVKVLIYRGLCELRAPLPSYGDRK